MGKALLERYGLYSIEDARKVDASILCQYGPDLDRGESPFIQPCIDGVILPEGVRDSLQNGHLHDICYMVGCTNKEAWSMRTASMPPAKKLPISWNMLMATIPKHIKGS